MSHSSGRFSLVILESPFLFILFYCWHFFLERGGSKTSFLYSRIKYFVKDDKTKDKYKNKQTKKSPKLGENIKVLLFHKLS